LGDLILARRYTRSQKAEILKHLDDNVGDVVLTSLQSGIPERTLRDWKRTRSLRPAAAENHRQRRHEHGNESPPSAAESAVTFEILNNLLVDKAFKIAGSLTQGLEDSPVHQRAIALAHLIDRILRLNATLPRLNDNNAVRIEFVAPDGTIHTSLDKLMWDEDAEWEENSRQFFALRSSPDDPD
jgi:hypothetical protein